MSRSPPSESSKSNESPPQVNIRNVELLNNPAKFKDQYQFRIKFEAIAPLAEGTSSLSRSFKVAKPSDLEWKLIYVGSAQSEEYDQELDSCMGKYTLKSAAHGTDGQSRPDPSGRQRL